MVQLIKLDLEGFGKFDKEKTILFKEGINFITGLNEVGKKHNSRGDNGFYF